MNRLELNYYYTSDKKLDPFTLNLDCLNLQLYFVLKAEVGESFEPYEAFLRDLNFGVTENRENLDNIFLMGEDYDRNIFCLKPDLGSGRDRLANVESHLDNADFVVVQTYTWKTPFFKTFLGYEAPNSAPQTDHVFLIIGHDESQLYYVESPWLIKHENYRPYPGNLSVGIVKKKDMQQAFDVLFNYAVVNIEERASLLDQEKTLAKIENTILACLENYRKEPSVVGDIRTCYGQDAVRTLVGKFEKKSCLPFETMPSFHWTFLDFYEWKIAEIVKPRQILLNCLKSNSPLFVELPLNRLFFFLEENIAKWQQVIASLKKNRSSGSRYWEPDLHLDFLAAANSEERVNNAIRTFWNAWKGIP